MKVNVSTVLESGPRTGIQVMKDSWKHMTIVFGFSTNRTALGSHVDSKDVDTSDHLFEADHSAKVKERKEVRARAKANRRGVTGTHTNH